jgi:hypothetical protein
MAIFEHNNLSWADMQLKKIEDREHAQKQDAAARFDQLHKEGGERFGMLWLQCNMALADMRELDYVPGDDRRIDALISECAWKMCERITELKARQREADSDVS